MAAASITIRPAKLEDLDEIMLIFDHARRFMQAHGNPTQWPQGYPRRELIVNEILNGYTHVCLTPEHGIVGTFCFMHGPDPTYSTIEDGQWLDDSDYCVVHRLASNGKVRAVAHTCFDWCFSHHHNIRVDTHHDNTIMQEILLRHGFTRCGIIYTHDNTRRIAYQRVEVSQDSSVQHSAKDIHFSFRKA